MVLGGDKAVGPPRVSSTPGSSGSLLRERDRTLSLGGWANPHAEAERQIDFLVDPDFCAEFYLTQIVSHYDMAPVARFIAAAERRGLTLPGLFGVFFYRSANRQDAGRARRASCRFRSSRSPASSKQGTTAEEVCARSIRALLDAGARHFYISNLPVGRAHTVLNDVLTKAGISR